MDMEKEIREKLEEIEEKENVMILLAVESGSRAWGFASPDSDYDVRFIYVRSIEEYLRLDEQKDVIDWQLDDVLDINGWDLKKALVQFRRGNATLFEWSNSPIVYRKTDELLTLPLPEELKASIKELLEIKRITGEKDLSPRMPVIHDFIAKELEVQKELADKIPDDHKKDWDVLNKLFRDALH